ncbi:ABC transporter substrate-binding protein [Cryptosporangium minutisporangium]|uniref:ABC transporter substrate-binding protein n=2 Tax=Cryptosporangium minutisporangium TaxID=113569 RepID=A0ABP6T472_9ACTN
MKILSRSVRRAVLVGAAALLLTASACSDPDSDSGSESAASITIGMQAPINSFDPADLLEGQQAYVWSALYDTLLHIDNDGKLQPNAAESWKYSDDARTLTLKLRDKMTFSSGDTVTAAAVKATLEHTIASAGSQRGNLEAVTAVEAPDERTVVLSLSRPDSSLLISLSQGAGVIGDPKTLNTPRTTLDPVGSGPYVLDRKATVNGSRYVLQRRDDYWNADAYPFRTLTVRVIADRTALFNALLSGELDAGTVDASQARAVKGAGRQLKRVEGVAIATLDLNDRAGTLAKPLGDVRVRRAINMAFDRSKIVEKIIGGLGQPTTQIFTPQSPAFDPALDKKYPYDPAAARKLLAEAGYAAGFSLTIPATVVSQILQPTITQSLGDIGITVNWKPVPPQDSGQTKEYAVYFNMAGTTPTPRTITLKLAPDGSKNPFKYKTPELAALIDKASTVTDPEQAAGIYQQINAYVVDDAWFAPIFSISANWVTKSGIEYLGNGAGLLSSVRTFGVTG